jgi:DNA-binding MarR family transcriptional regulator
MGLLAHHVGSVAEAHGLTHQQLMLLRSLEAPRPMRDVATEMCCDPSNVTGMIDRLEARGLVERTPGSVDRRVKMLSLSAEGRTLRKKLERELQRRLLKKAAWGNAQTAIDGVHRLLGCMPDAEARRGSRSD